jgi:hypothetical protein
MIVLERWIENLRCPVCRKTGAARLSQADGWNAHVDSVPEGFEVVRLEYGSNFYVLRATAQRTPNDTGSVHDLFRWLQRFGVSVWLLSFHAWALCLFRKCTLRNWVA